MSVDPLPCATVGGVSAASAPVVWSMVYWEMLPPVLLAPPFKLTA